jgi:hypothetical protein
VQLDPGRPFVGAPRASSPPPGGDDGPPIHDPFAPPPRRDAAVDADGGGEGAALGLGLASVLLGPLTGVPAIVLGVLGRRRPDAPRRGRATAGLVLGIVFTLLHMLAAAGAVVFFLLRDPPRPEPVAAATPPEGASIPAEPRKARDPGPHGSVPQATTEVTLGDLTLVDIGFSEPALAQALAQQVAAATAKGQTVLVHTTRGGCEPCDGFVASLSDPLMQVALANVRVVRVDIDVFGADLDGLRIQRETLPGFFLLGPDLSPRDGIHGGEWGDDVAANIAPVLGPFVRGALVSRKYPFRVPPARPRGPGDPGGRDPARGGANNGGGVWL